MKLCRKLGFTTKLYPKENWKSSAKSWHGYQTAQFLLQCHGFFQYIRRRKGERSWKLWTSIIFKVGMNTCRDWESEKERSCWSEGHGGVDAVRQQQSKLTKCSARSGWAL